MIEFGFSFVVIMVVLFKSFVKGEFCVKFGNVLFMVVCMCLFVFVVWWIDFVLILFSFIESDGLLFDDLMIVIILLDFEIILGWSVSVLIFFWVFELSWILFDVDIV